ncbi:MAG: hypothetical protein IJZ30_00515 [Alphaproteobacteria bacterium]|nr:hypothetical protein [Alphaproteobacteria bacterium]
MRIEDAFGENLSSFDEIDVENAKFLKTFRGAIKAKRQALRDMKETGMFEEKPKNDDYINNNTLDVVLDDVLLVENFNKFISSFQKAIALELDDVVFDVIDNLGSNKNVAILVLKSLKPKYVYRLIEKNDLSNKVWHKIDRSIKQKVEEILYKRSSSKRIKNFIVKFC